MPRETVVILPGVGRSVDHFAGHTQYLRARGFDAKVQESKIVVDHRGIVDFEASARMIIPSLPTEKPVLASHSLGGLLSLAIMSEGFPVKGAVITSAPAGSGFKTVDKGLAVGVWSMRYIPESLGKRLVQLFNGNEILLTSPWRSLLWPVFWGHMSKDWRPLIAKIDPRIPIVAWYGQRDKIGQAAGNRAIRDYSNLRLIEHEGGHTAPSPEVLYDLICKLNLPIAQ